MSAKLISPYSFPGLKRELLDKRKYSYVFNATELMISKEEILEIIGREMGLSTTMIMSRCRESKYVDARNLYCKVLKTALKYNYPALAKEMGKDHTTIIWGINKFQDRYDCEEDFREISNRVFKKVGIKI